MRNFDDVFNAPDLSLSIINYERGLEVSRSAVVIPICEVVDFFNVGKTMNDTQVAITVDLILDVYSYLKLEDLKLCFRKAMLGLYGKQYDRLDGAIILEWLKEYDRERATVAAEMSINEANRQRGDTPSLADGVFYEDRIKGLVDAAQSGDDESIENLKRAMDIRDKLSKFGQVL